MKDKIFLDSNIVIYSLGLDNQKKKIALDLLKQVPTLSVQVINEVVYIATKKLKIPREESYEIGRMLGRNCDIVPLNKSTVLKGFEISERYNLSHWDSLIIAAALENGCTLLYSEDMHHNLLVEKQLRLRNPFSNTN